MDEKFYKRTWFIVLCCIIFPPAGIALMWINRKPIRKNARIILSIFLCLWTFALVLGGGDYETKNKENEKTVAENADNETENKENDQPNLQDSRKSKEADSKREENGKEKDKSKKKEMKQKTNQSNSFPNTEKYTVNNVLLNYDKIAEYPIGEEFIRELKEIGRPLGRTCITVSNGVYFIIRYNDYNKTLFIDYQEETNDDSGILSVMRDLIKATNPEINDEEIYEMWKELKTGNYSSYYGEKYNLKGFEVTFTTAKINNGQTRYDIKTSYKN